VYRWLNLVSNHYIQRSSFPWQRLYGDPSRSAFIILMATTSSVPPTPTPDSDCYLENFCKQILAKDYFIKSATITDDVGHIIASAHRSYSVDIMTPEENSRAAAQAAIRAATRNKFRPKLGELLFSISRYEHEVRATVPIKGRQQQEQQDDHYYNYNNGSDSNSIIKNKFLLLLSFDTGIDADYVILKKYSRALILRVYA
jgi:hypothetical protein